MIALPVAAYTSKKFYPNINRNVNPNIKPADPSYSYSTPKSDLFTSKVVKSLKGFLRMGKWDGGVGGGECRELGVFVFCFLGEGGWGKT